MTDMLNKNKLFVEVIPLVAETDNKSAAVLEHNTNDEKDSAEPSECKIPKTNSDEAKSLESETETVEVKVIYNKNKYDVKAPLDGSVADFKKQLEQLLGELCVFDLINYYLYFISKLKGNVAPRRENVLHVFVLILCVVYGSKLTITI